MMTDFWLASSGLIFLAFIIIVLPVFKWRKTKQQAQAHIDRKTLNVAVYKDRIKELEREKKEGLWDEAQFEQLLAELQGGLLDDVDGLDDSAPITPMLQNKGRALLVVVVALLIAVPAISYGLYGKWGAYNDLAQFRTLSATMSAQQSGMPQKDINELLKQLKSRLQADPDNPKNMDGWYMLARSNMKQNNYDEAADAFMQLARLLSINKEDPSAIYGLAAQARYFESKGIISEAVQTAIDKAFAANPDEVNTLGLLGMDDFQHKRFESAIKHWSRILEVQPDNPSRESIISGLKAAQKQLKKQGKSIDIAVLNKPKAATASITVSVDISDELKAKSAPGDLVFVFAKAVQGPPMPLAVSRKHVSDLPFTVTLDDSMAMSPMAKLSSVPTVNIVARISKSGKPIASAGDFEGRAGNVATDKPASVKVVIDKTL